MSLQFSYPTFDHVFENANFIFLAYLCFVYMIFTLISLSAIVFSISILKHTVAISLHPWNTYLLFIYKFPWAS